MSSFNNNQVNELFPGLEKIMQGYAGSLDGEACVYGHSQPVGPSESPTQESVLSPATSSMALFAHQAQAAANPNTLSAMASGTSHFSHGVTQRAQIPKTANQMASTSSQDGQVPPPANQPARRRRKLITPVMNNSIHHVLILPLVGHFEDKYLAFAFDSQNKLASASGNMIV
ncbi:hypothetical protein DSO57_1013606 [Entomophthora muscae]|uniref:Uncharacterized protein n=1 Tax=Entomophthora muscae TaxID=34485 RepID=A0ACC2TSV5_9FUNG|nr:hypothetical protein DSO57_1013606 [Entomophthora muscae]